MDPVIFSSPAEVVDTVFLAAVLSQLPDGKIAAVNALWARLFGYTKEEVIGKTTLELGINPDADGRVHVIAMLKQDGFVHNYPIKLHTKSGQVLEVLISIDLVQITGEQYLLNTIQPSPSL